MDTKNNTFAMGTDQMKALFAWWSSGNDGSDGIGRRQIIRFQKLGGELQKACIDACNSEMSAMFSGNGRLGHSFQELLQVRRPQEVWAAEVEMMAAMLEEGSERAKRWTEFTQKIQDCCTATTREAAADLREVTQAAAPRSES